MRVCLDDNLSNPGEIYRDKVNTDHVTYGHHISNGSGTTLYRVEKSSSKTSAISCPASGEDSKSILDAKAIITHGSTPATTGTGTKTRVPTQLAVKIHRNIGKNNKSAASGQNNASGSQASLSTATSTEERHKELDVPIQNLYEIRTRLGKGVSYLLFW